MHMAELNSVSGRDSNTESTSERYGAATRIRRGSQARLRATSEMYDEMYAGRIEEHSLPRRGRKVSEGNSSRRDSYWGGRGVHSGHDLLRGVTGEAEPFHPHRAIEHTVNLADLAVSPEQRPISFKEKSQGLAQQALRRHRRGCCVVDPRSSLAVGIWDTVTGSALIFTAVVTPYEVAFIAPATLGNEWYFILNRIVDAVFVIDLILQFFMM